MRCQHSRQQQYGKQQQGRNLQDRLRAKQQQWH
jgi:hypothetical protein